MARKRNNNKSPSANPDKRSAKRSNAFETSVDTFNDNDSVLNDTASVISMGGFSIKSNRDVDSGRDTPNDYGDEDFGASNQQQIVDNFSMKFAMIMDDLPTIKSLKDRLRLYDSLAEALRSRYCFKYLENRKMALEEIVERGLKQSDDEAASAALIVSLVLLTFTTDNYSEDLFKLTHGLLERNLTDPSAKPIVRSKCATALSIGCYITDFGKEKIINLCEQLLSIVFSSVGGRPDAEQLMQVNNMKAHCLQTYCFLLPCCVDYYGYEEYSPIIANVQQIQRLLESNHLELRVSAGKCVALLYELHDTNEIMGDDIIYFGKNSNIYELISQLSKDSNKSRSKKELRTQRGIFRKILDTLDNQDYETETFKISCRKFEIDSWQESIEHEMFLNVFQSGINVHMQENPLFVGDYIDNTEPITKTKADKLIEKNVNNANRKMREKGRKKARGKRVDLDF